MPVEIIARAAAVLCALNGTDGAPESTGYLACGSCLSTWSAVSGILTRAGWVKISGHWMTLTADGAKKAKALEALVNKS